MGQSPEHYWALKRPGIEGPGRCREQGLAPGRAGRELAGWGIPEQVLGRTASAAGSQVRFLEAHGWDKASPQGPVPLTEADSLCRS